MLARTGQPLGRKLTALREIQVGRAKRTVSPHKPLYHGLAELFAAQRRRS